MVTNLPEPVGGAPEFLTGLLAGLTIAGFKTLKAVNDVSSVASVNLQEFEVFNGSAEPGLSAVAV